MSAECRTLVLRGDAGEGVGLGHIRRLLALGEAWVRQGGRGCLVTATPTGTVQAAAREMGCALVDLPGRPDVEADCGAIMRELEGSPEGSWVAVDGYRFRPEFLSLLRGNGARVLRIDDAPKGHVPCDALLDPAPGAEELMPDVPAEALLLSGPSWMPLRAAFARSAQVRRPVGPLARVLVSFGGWDPGDATSLALRALSLARSKAEVVVIVGDSNPHADSILARAEAIGAKVERSADMPALMAWADLAVIGGGVTSLEACAVGLPAIVVTIAGNQAASAAALAARGALVCLGPAEGVSDAELAATLDRMIADGPFREGMSKAGRSVVDGLGARRVAAALAMTARDSIGDSDVVIRPATRGDLASLWQISNDPAVRASSFRRAPIPFDEYRRWYFGVLGDPDARYWLLEVAGVVAAQVRYSLAGGEAEVHFSVHGAFRGRGLGRRALESTRELACRGLKARRLKGVVIEPNEPSMRTFVGAGWRRVGGVLRDGRRCALFEVPCS